MARRTKIDTGNTSGMPNDPEILASGEGSPASENKRGEGENSGGTQEQSTEESTNGTGQKRRGRPKGSKNRSATTEKTAIDLNGLEKLLYSIHAIAAVKIAPELELSDKESSQLASAISAVSEHYDLTIDPKTQAWIQLIICVGIIYAPRAMRIRERVIKRDNANVVPLHAPTG